MNVTSIAVSGMRANETRLSVAAENTANALTPAYEEKQVVQKPLAAGGVETDVLKNGQDVSIENALVEANLATYNFQANLKVLQAQSENEKSLLDIQA